MGLGNEDLEVLKVSVCRSCCCPGAQGLLCSPLPCAPSTIHLQCLAHRPESRNTRGIRSCRRLAWIYSDSQVIYLCIFLFSSIFVFFFDICLFAQERATNQFQGVEDFSKRAVTRLLLNQVGRKAGVSWHIVWEHFMMSQIPEPSFPQSHDTHTQFTLLPAGKTAEWLDPLKSHADDWGAHFLSLSMEYWSLGNAPPTLILQHFSIPLWCQASLGEIRWTEPDP